MNHPTIRWIGDEHGHAELIDQTLLPGELRYTEIRSKEDMWDAIKRLAIRGALVSGDTDGAARLARRLAGSNDATPHQRRRARATLAEIKRLASELKAGADMLIFPAEPDVFFATAVTVSCGSGTLAGGAGPGSWRIGWTTTEALPTTYTFLGHLDADSPRTLLVPGISTTGSPHLVIWRPGSEPLHIDVNVD